MSNIDSVMIESKYHPKVWSFLVPHIDDRFLVDGFNFIIECYSSREELLWTQQFASSDAMSKFISREFPSFCII